MNQDDMRRVGAAMGQRLWGRGRFQRMQKSGQELHSGFWDLALAAWTLYARPGLEPRIRSLCLVAALTALGRTDELRLHVFGALNNEASQAEIEEAIVQVAPYAGLPVARQALIAAKRAFAEYQPVTDRG